MHIPRFWASASDTVPHGSATAPLKTRGWSDTSVAEARQKATETLRRIAGRIRDGSPFPDKYAYTDRPVAEEILEELRAPGGELEGVVTRNGYGAQVLNSAKVLIADVDDPPAPSIGLGGMLKQLFGGGNPSPGGPQVPSSISAFIAARPDWGFRIYRTKAGWRVFVTHALFDPTAPGTIAQLEEFGSDPQYVQLSRAQGSFRARLTPKPWRCGIARPIRAFPRETAAVEREHERWLRGYERASDGFATCRFVSEVGRARACDTAHRLITLHDRVTRAESERDLA